MSNLSPSNYAKIPSSDYPQSYNDQDDEEQRSSNYDSPPIQSKSLSPRNLINSPNSDHDTITSLGQRNVDFYDSEEEEDLGRYSIAFNQTLGNDNGGQSQSQNGYQPAKRGTPSMHNFNREDSKNRLMQSSPMKRLFHKIQDARMETRRKRWERLLALPDEATLHFHKERCGLFFGTWCDLLDKGIIPIIFMIGIYAIILSMLSDEHAFVKNVMLGVGIPLFIFRISWRPLCWLVYERRQARRVRTKLFSMRCSFPTTHNAIHLFRFSSNPLPTSNEK